MVAHPTVHIRVPATSANLGPGYDSFGLALDLWDEIYARPHPAELTINVSGVGADSVPRNASHLVIQAAQQAADVIGMTLPALELSCINRIPHGGGLGSSAAAIVSGILLARAFAPAQADYLTDEAVFSLATALEGHPDNVAPALFGGFTLAWMSHTPPVAPAAQRPVSTSPPISADEAAAEPLAVAVMDQGTAQGRAHCVRLDPASQITAVVFTARSSFSTSAARAALPTQIPHADAAANAARAGLLVHAISHDPQYLFEATRDWLHQDYRGGVMPQAAELLHRLRTAGIPAVLSGAGPAILALGTQDELDRLQVERYTPTEEYDAHRIALNNSGATVANAPWPQ